MRSNLDVARLLLRRAGSDLADVRRTLASEGPYDTAVFHLPFDLAEFNPFAVTIRYDDEAVSLALTKEMFDKCNQVLAVVVAALPEEIRP